MTRKKNLRWEEMDKSNTDLSVLMQHFEVNNRTEGKSPKTVGWYNEVLGLFIRWLGEDGSSTAIGDIDENTVRRFILHICVEVSATWALPLLSWDTFGSFLGAVDLYPAPGVRTHHHPQVFLPLKVSHYR